MCTFARALEHLGGRRAEGRLEQAAVGDALLQRVGDGARLLVDLLQHEVRGTGPSRRHPADSSLSRTGRSTVLPSRSMTRTDRRADLGDVALFEEHEAARHRQQRRHVGGDEILIHARGPMTTGQPSRASDQPVRVVLADHRQRVGALELRHRGAHRLEQVAERLQVVVDAMRDHLGVGLGAELVAAPLEVRAQLLVVLDDAVVHDREPVARDVRVRVALARHPVGGPAGVGDADLAGGRALLQRLARASAPCRPCAAAADAPSR